jgi:hypothetical protein
MCFRHSLCGSADHRDTHVGRSESVKQMSNTYSGSCLCGEVRFEIEGEFEPARAISCVEYAADRVANCRGLEVEGPSIAERLEARSIAIHWELL